MKFVVTDRQIASDTIAFQNSEEALRSPLARKLFGFPWASQILIGPNFVTVTKQEWVDWKILAEPLASLIEEHIVRGEPVLSDANHASAKRTDRTAAVVEPAPNAPIEERLEFIIETQIRPAVAMDGGDVALSRFDRGVVYLEMRGACSGCPSASLTLKEGIEVRLKEIFPEVQAVESI